MSTLEYGVVSKNVNIDTAFITFTPPQDLNTQKIFVTKLFDLVSFTKNKRKLKYVTLHITNIFQRLSRIFMLDLESTL